MSYWRDYWESHARSSHHAPVQVQVLRTWQKQPVSDELFQQIVAWILGHLSLESQHDVLDLCCGNGAITHQLAARCRSVVAVDFSADLLTHVATHNYPHIATQCLDIRDCQFADASFDRIVLYAGLQYLTQHETIRLVRNLRQWLRPGGRIVLGDVPDAERIWNFFDTPPRRHAYFEQLAAQQPIIGTWFASPWLEHLAYDAGFARAVVLSQPASFPFQHFRFDLLLEL